MNTKSNKTEEIQTELEQNSVDKSKRSFSKAGMAAPILLSFASRPAWARVDNCSFDGAMASGNMSHGPVRECTGGSISSRSQGQLKSHPEEFPEIADQYTDKFNGVFFAGPSVTLSGSSENSNPSMLEVLQANGNIAIIYNPPISPQIAAKFYVAAYLLASSDKYIFPYTVNDIVADWGSGLNLLPKLQLIVDGEDLTVAEVDALINP